MPRREAMMCATAAILIASALAWSNWGYSFDDNFITYRYARNWIAGEGLVYNLGEAVLGSSAPGYALLLGALSAVTAVFGVGIPAWGTLISVLSILWLGHLLHRALDRRRPWLCLGFVAVALTFPLDVYLLGSELFPITALVAEAAFQLLDRRRSVVGGLLIFGAVFLRLDAGLAAIALGVVAWGSARRPPLRFALSGLLPLAAWLGLLATWFGTVIPLTLDGKKALREVPYTLRQWQMLELALPTAAAVVLLLGAAVGIFLSVRSGLLRRWSAVALCAWLAAHEIAYRLVGVWFAPWYHLPLLLAVLALFTAGALLAAREIGERLPAAAHGRWAAPVLTTLLLAPVLVPALQFVAKGWREPPDTRLRVYREAGRWIDLNVPPDARILASEIGVLGWESKRRILDYSALVSPAFTAAKLSSTRPRLVVELAPDYIVVNERDDDLGAVVAGPELEGCYGVAATFSRPEHGRGEVRVLERLTAGDEGITARSRGCGVPRADPAREAELPEE